ncbi:hypothetical protein CWB85_16775 [Pseudoalteromonas sp. S1727]|nr:hypothetical protein CWB85_16775 [Pseudoalteromonas sp. S1727]
MFSFLGRRLYKWLLYKQCVNFAAIKGADFLFLYVQLKIGQTYKYKVQIEWLVADIGMVKRR